MIYLDAATTVQPSADVRMRLSETLKDSWGNVSGAHQASRQAKNALESARENFSNNLGVSPENIIFTSGATESLNIAIQGFSRKFNDATIFYSAIEHPAVANTARYLSENGRKVVELSVDSSGIIRQEQFENVNAGDLVCVMPVNNEIGVINDVEKISQLVHSRGAYLLLDCVQSFYSFDPKQLCAISDFAVFSSHKLGGPQGVGLLVAKNRKLVDALTLGGSQEWEIRPGTTPAFLIDAFDFVFDRALKNRTSDVDFIQQLNIACLAAIAENIDDVSVHCEDAARSPHIISVDIAGIEAQMLVAMVDAKGVCVSRGSACASGASTPSPVLLALGIDQSKTNSTIRISFSPQTQISQMLSGIQIIADAVAQLRSNTRVGAK